MRATLAAFFEEGARVRSGQILAVLDDSLLRSQIDQVRATLAQQQVAAEQAAAAVSQAAAQVKASAEQKVGAMLDQVYGFAPTTHVFVASPLVQLNPPWGGTAAYDAALTAMVQGKIDAGRPYHIVRGMNSIAGAANYSDPIHLSVAGYDLMAQKWADALLAATGGDDADV